MVKTKKLNIKVKKHIYDTETKLLEENSVDAKKENITRTNESEVM